MNRRPQQGFSLIELLVVVGLVVFLFVMSFERLLPLRGAAEQVQVQQTIGALRSAIGFEAARRVVQGGGIERIWAMERQDPLRWLTVTPKGYRAEGPSGARGEWAFDARRGELVYRLRYPEYVFTADGRPELRWRIARLGSPGEHGVRVSIDLVPVVAHAWLPRAGVSEILAWIER